MTRREIRNCAFILIMKSFCEMILYKKLYETADEIEEITVRQCENTG